MNTGQALLSILALVLLGTTVLSVNRNSLNNGTILRQTELGIYAVSLATSYIQKAKSMDFDEKSIPGLAIGLPMPAPTTTILSGTLGVENPRLNLPPPANMETNETTNCDNTYDDFDDYNGYVKDTLITGVDKFHVAAVVYYVNNAAPFNKVVGPTWLKQIDIKVNNTVDRAVFTKQSGTDTIKMSYIKGFYY